MQISFESRGAEEAKEEEDRGGWGANRRESGAINANFRNIFPVKVIRTDSSSDVGTIIVEFNYSVIRANTFCFDEWIGFCFSFLFVFFKDILKIFKIDRGKNGLPKKILNLHSGYILISWFGNGVKVFKLLYFN